MNSNYVAPVKEEIDKLLKVGFIKPMKSATWFLPICVYYRKLNATTISNPFPLSFTDWVLNDVIGLEMYSFMDGFSGSTR